MGLLPRTIRLLLLGGLSAAAACAEKTPTTVPSEGAGRVEVTVFVATSMRAGPAADPDRLGEEVGRAAYEFAVAGLELGVAKIEFVSLGSADPRTRRGRRRILRRTIPGTVPVVYVHDSGRNSRGKWIARDGIIVVDTDATPTTLAHELGHALGLPHEDEPNNIMCSCDREGRPTFSQEQRDRLRAGTVAFGPATKLQ